MAAHVPQRAGVAGVSGRGRGASRHLPTLLALLFGALYAFQLFVHATRTSATVDEPVHMLAGYRHLACGDFAFNPEHPPLLKQVAALPLVASGDVRAPTLPCDAGFTPKQASFHLGNRFLVDNGVYPILIPARAAAGLFSLAMAILLFLGLRRMLGAGPATLAVGLLALEPMMIAHGSLVTTDMAITLATFAAVLALHRGPTMRPLSRTLSLGAAFGLMLLSKHSALVIFPVLGLLLLVDARLRADSARAWPRLASQDAGYALLASCIALLMLWAGYGFRDAAGPGRAPAVVIGDFLVQVGRPGIGQTTAAGVLHLLDATRLFPESYLMGLADIIGTGERPSRILGNSYPRGQWFYFPIALLLKTGLATLLLLPVGVWALWRDPGKRRVLFYLALPPAGYLLASMTSGINIGARHVLPMYPFLLALAAAGGWWMWRTTRLSRFALVMLLAYQALVVWRSSPDYIPFANAAWGPAPHAILQDANVEWGQSLKRVEEDARQRGVVDRCWYAGVGAPILHAAEQPCRLLPDGYRWVVVDPELATVPRRIAGTIYLSVRMLPPRGGREYEPLLRAGPTRMLAGTLLVFEGEFDLPLVAALSHARRADALVVGGRLEEALVESQRAMSLGQDDPRVRISHANVLVHRGARVGALQHARAAQASLAKEPELYGFVRPRLGALLAALAVAP